MKHKENNLEENNKIDFVITWVDGNDPEWLKEKENYSPNQKETDSKDNRYRSWDNLQYWFRGVEKFAPWVNKIFFVTWGHIPKWININNPKLKIVKHEDFIPKEYLPTFNSSAIQLCLHKIEELSDNFVSFNDDMFLTNIAKKEDFFRNNLPCDMAIISPIISAGRDKFANTLQNNMAIINTSFSKNECIKKNFFKWINYKYGKNMLRTICLMPWRHFAGFYDTHLPLSLNKKTFETIWNREFEAVSETLQSKFRNNNTGITEWVMRYWQLVEGKFYPRHYKIGKYFEYGEDNREIYGAIENQKYKMICLNDVDTGYDFEKEKNRTIEAFEKILPNKSSFEI